MSSWRYRAYSALKGMAPPVVRNALELQLSSTSGLRQLGWGLSRKLGVPVDQDGEPIPWYTYPSIRFLEPRIPTDAVVFEYGSGQSTLWWAKRTAKVVSVEHNREWADRLRRRLPDKAEVLFHDAQSDAYVQAANRYGGRYDIVVIDGRRRVKSVMNCLDGLSERGVIIWDNSEREYYRGGYEFLAENGFKPPLNFYGLGPINTEEWCTSVFYKGGNCLGI